MDNIETNNESIGRSEKLDIRLTVEEKAFIVKNAEACGIKPSNYARKVLLGTVPKKRMTDREREYLDHISDAKANLDRITRVLGKSTDTRRRELFGTTSFMMQWIAAVDEFIRYMTRLREKIMQD